MNTKTNRLDTADRVDDVVADTFDNDDTIVSDGISPDTSRDTFGNDDAGVSDGFSPNASRGLSPHIPIHSSLSRVAWASRGPYAKRDTSEPPNTFFGQAGRSANVSKDFGNTGLGAALHFSCPVAIQPCGRASSVLSAETPDDIVRYILG